MSDPIDSSAAGIQRRALLKGTTGMAGILATGMAPFVHAQEKIVLRYLGTAVNQDKAIGDKFKADTGIEIQYVAVTTDDVTKRAVTAPNSFDLIDTEFFSLKKIVPTGNLKGIDTKKIKNADKITSLFTKGEVAGKAVGDQGTAPKKVIYLEGEKSKKFSTTPTQFMSLIPTVYNADTLGIRPDLIKRPITSWAELLNPEFKGKAAILNIPSIGIMDAAMVVEAKGIHKYKDKGNMTKAEIDLTIKTLIEAKKAGQFRALWKDFNESVNLMASGEVVIQSMWSPAVTAVRTKGIACNFQPLKEGYRAWAAGFGLPATLSGKKLDGAYEFINWFLDGWAGAYPQSPGLLQRGARDRQVQDGSLRVGLLDGRQARREGHQEPERRPARQDRRGARRRQLRSAHGRHRLLERGHGRERVHGPQVERVRRRLKNHDRSH